MTQKLSKSEAGRRGGLATASRYGSEHMRDIGTIGAIAKAELHYGGDVQAMMSDLHLIRKLHIACQSKEN